MKSIFIKDKNTILAMALKGGNFPKNLQFHTKDADFVQVATWNYAKGKKTTPHAHKVAKKTAGRTQEVIYVKKGKVRAAIYGKKDALLKKVTLKEGEFIIIFEGGHSFEILEEGTQVLEVKNGPYLGVEKDKRVIEK